MKTGQKLSVSLLCAVLLVAGFVFAGVTGLFDYVETHFHNPRVEAQYHQRLRTASQEITAYHERTRGETELLLEEGAFRTVFRANQSREEIEERRRLLERFVAQEPGFDYIRIVSEDGDQLYYSSREEDYEGTDTRREYVAVEEMDGNALVLELLQDTIESPQLTMEPDGGRFIYLAPSYDEEGIRRGTALIYIGLRSLENRLAAQGVMQPGRNVEVVSESALVLDVPRELRTAFATALDGVSAARVVSDTLRVEDEEDRRFRVLGLENEIVGAVGMAVPEREFVMSSVLETALGATVFLSVFLIVFLLLSLRQDPELVVAERVKRFQLHLLREYLEGKQDLNLDRWRRELRNRKREVVKQLSRGVRQRKRKTVEELASRSWDEIVETLGPGAVGASEKPGASEMRRIEDRLERLLEAVQRIGGGGRVAEEDSGETVADVRERADRLLTAGVRGTEGDRMARGEEAAEELDEEETDSAALLSALRSAGEVEGLEATEGAGTVEELEQISQAEETDELGPAEEHGAGELEAAEEYDAEELEPVDGDGVDEPLEEGRELEVVDELDEIETAEEAEPAEELEEVEAAEATEEPEPLEALEEAEAGETEPAATLPEPDRSGTHARYTEAAVAGERASLAELTEMLSRRETAVIQEQGLVRINERLYEGEAQRSRGEGGDRHLRGDPGQQPRRHAEPSVSPEQLEELSGVLTLGGGRLASLSGEPPRSRETDEEAGAQKRRLVACGDGIDFDDFLRNYPQGETGVVRGIMDLSRYAGAVAALLLTYQTDGSMTVSHWLGIDQECAASFEIPETSTLNHNVFSSRAIYFAEHRLSELGVTSDSCRAGEVDRFGRPLFLPVRYRGEGAYLALGMGESEASLNELFRRIHVRMHKKPGRPANLPAS